jgi:GT2 family glycosyltransferase
MAWIETGGAATRQGTERLRGSVHAAGKFIEFGGEKLYLRGVTYGTFAPDERGEEFGDRALVADDFAAMAESGFNAVRTYTVPPTWLLDLAADAGLRLLVGIPWEQHVTFLDDRRRSRSIEARIRAGVASCAEHPAVLGYAVGNEIPAPIVRWHGRRRVESFLERLYNAAKEEDPAALATYVNYPSTEYLQLPFLDLVAFNVYLESPGRFASYLARLQTIAGDRPLVLAELGLDSRRHGLERQAASLDWQVRTAFEGGCAGTFVFAWTDEWARGGSDIEDWDFGLTDRARAPKPALGAVAAAYADAPFPAEASWPRITVAVCSHNGAATLRTCLERTLEVDYPDFEVIVVDDGSTDETAAIAASFGVRVVRTPNRGLSAARNTALELATGELVAYLDDDAWPDRHWLSYLARAFRTSTHALIGGPNVPPPPRNLAERAIAAAPGGPIHVLLSDELAEHVPGCNLAVRRDVLRELGGFDPQFRAAGDDVDICWRILESGLTVGFEPAAMVWHHRRDSVRGYLRQQRGYGKAEALLERKWPERYNALGHAIWHGRVYGAPRPRPVGRRWRVYQGVWGSAPFQRLYRSPASLLGLVPLMPEWTLGLALLSILGIFWTPLLAAVPVLAAVVGATVVHAYRATAGAGRARLLATALTLLQPSVRLWGRIDHGLTPWRRRGHGGFALPRPRDVSIWSESWVAPTDRLAILEEGCRGDGAAIEAGGDFDRWDLQVRGGLLGSARLRMAIEEHGEGRQLVRFRCRPRLSPVVALLAAVAVALAVANIAWDDSLAAILAAALAILLVLRAVFESGAACAVLLHGVQRQEELADFDLAATLARRARESRVRVARA